MIRATTADQLRALGALEAAATPWPWSAEAIASSLEAGAEGWWIDDGDGPIGHLLTRRVLDEAEVLTLAVHPSARRRGLARRLLVHAEAFWVAQGVTHAFLEVREDNEGARALYGATGWTEVARRRGYYRDGETAVILVSSPGSAGCSRPAGP